MPADGEEKKQLRYKYSYASVDPEEKRVVIVEAMKVDSLRRLCSSLEPLFRRIFTLCKVCSVQFGQKAIPYTNTNDVCAIRYPDPLIKANETITLDLETNKIIDFIKFHLENFILLTGGLNRGYVAIIKIGEKFKDNFETDHICERLSIMITTNMGLDS